MSKKIDAGTFENAADQAVLSQLPQDLDERNNLLDGDDPIEAAPTPDPATIADPEPEPAPQDEPPVAAAPAAESAPAAAPAPAAAAPAEPAAPAAPAAPAHQAAAPAQAAEPIAAPQPVRFQTRSPQELQEARTQIAKDKLEATKKYDAGEITPEQYAEALNKADDALLGVATEAALITANQQTLQQTSAQALTAFKALAKNEGLVDYDADQNAQAEFNAAAAMLENLPSARNLTDAQFYAKVHQQVLALRGLSPKPAAAPAPAAPAVDPKAAVDKALADRQPPAPPVTLRGVPAAATPNANGGLAEQLGRLSGPAFEEAFAKLTPAQRAAMLDEE